MTTLIAARIVAEPGWNALVMDGAAAGRPTPIDLTSGEAPLSFRVIGAWGLVLPAGDPSGMPEEILLVGLRVRATLPPTKTLRVVPLGLDGSIIEAGLLRLCPPGETLHEAAATLGLVPQKRPPR